MGEEADFDKKKGHRQRHAGRKAERKAAKDKHVQDLTAQQRNPKAFAFQSAVKAQRRFVRTQDIKAKKHHIPVVDRTPVEPPPVIVAVVGGPKVGKSSLLRGLIKNYTNQKLSEINGPVTVVAGKKRRLTFMEVNNDINCMIDVAKIADIVLMLIDATFGIEMEIFEFLEICRAHGSPRIMGVLNHLDMLKDNKALKKKKKTLKHRFQVELYPGAKLFYLSGLIHGEYLKNEIRNLGRFISVMKFRPLTWRTTHPFILVDRYEDISNPEAIRTNPKCDRDVVLYGYVRGIPFQRAQTVHIPGCGDFRVKDISFLPDPCPLPEQLKKRSLNAKERLTYAPMSGVGGVVYDKDAVYIDLGGSHHGVKAKDVDEEAEEGEKEDDVLQSLLEQQKTVDEKQAQSHIQLFSHSKFISEDVSEGENPEPGEGQEDVDTTDSSTHKGLPAHEVVVDDSGRVRRRAIFADNLEEESGNEEEEEEDSDSEEEPFPDEEEEEEEEQQEEEEHELAPPKKKFKSNQDSDSEDYDIDADLQKVQRTKPAENLTSEKKQKSKNKNKPMIKNSNKDSDVTQKIQGLLEKISAVSSQSSKPQPMNNKSVSKSQQESAGCSEEESADEDTEGPNGSTQDKSQQHDSGVEEEAEEDKFEYRNEMFREASDNFMKNQSTVSFLKKYIYGNAMEEESEEEDEEEEVGGLFQRVGKKARPSGARLSYRAIMDNTDTSRYTPPFLRDWSSQQVLKSIRDCFMTGEWREGEDAETLLKMDEEEVFGDFEDLESGTKFTAKEEEKQVEEEGAEGGEEVKKEEKTKREKLLEKKRRLKEMFDAEYDDKGDGDHFDSLKAEMSQQAQLNREAFDGLDEQARVEYEGFRPGLYVRLEFSRFPCEFVTHFDPSYPVIVGGLLDNEKNMGLVRARIKVHRWYPKILKNRDPLILSLGWRRFQTLMYYAKREDNFRMRSLKYARKYLHVEAIFWGPITAVNTGLVALQNIKDRVPEFRIAANGVVLEMDQSCKIVKKLKLMGTPDKILKKTAFIKDMFHSDTELAKFEGAKIQTQSGIRGIIKKAKGDKGLFRATFEDVIKTSDVVILKTWVPLEVARHAFSMRTLLLPPTEKAQWQGMRTVAQIKKDKGLKNLPNPDSLYTPITERRQYDPQPLKVPKELQKALPYGLKPKNTPRTQKERRVMVVKDPHEIQMDNFMKRLRTMMDDKIAKEQQEKLLRRKKFQKDIKEREHMKQVRMRRDKASACRINSKKQGKKKVV